MRTFHTNWAFLLVALNLVAGLWGLIWVRRNPPPPKAFWPLVYAGQAAVAIQVVFGVVLHQQTPANGIHMFYGFVLLIAAALAWAFRNPDAKRNITIYASIALFIAAVGGIRGIPTA